VLTRLAIASLLLVGLFSGCSREKVDPVVQIRALVPEIATALNSRDIAGLRRLGTSNLEANRLIVEVFPDGGADSITFRFKKVVMEGDDAALFVQMGSSDELADPAPELVFDLVGNGHWRIDAFRLIEPLAPPDTVQVDTSGSF
jgi:hypothetical protein